MTDVAMHEIAVTDPETGRQFVARFPAVKYEIVGMEDWLVEALGLELKPAADALTPGRGYTSARWYSYAVQMANENGTTVKTAQVILSRLLVAPETVDLDTEIAQQFRAFAWALS